MEQLDKVISWIIEHITYVVAWFFKTLSEDTFKAYSAVVGLVFVIFLLRGFYNIYKIKKKPKKPKAELLP